MKQTLYTVEEVQKKISAGETLILAGDEQLLCKLPKGQWVGGTIPYFIGQDGGEFSTKKIFVTEMPQYIVKTEIAIYNEETIPNVYKDAPANGFTFIMIPTFSKTHLSFALNAPSYEQFAYSPLVGWITGVDVKDLGKITAKIFDGRQPIAYDEGAIVMRIFLPEGKVADMGIINIFEPGNGATIQFDHDGFSTKEAMVDGKKRDLAQYLAEVKADSQLPLVADYCGAIINIGVRSIAPEKGEVLFYAPVFQGITYKHAAPVGDYVATFTQHTMGINLDVFFSCNCISNYFYSKLEGRKTCDFMGPMTFGEIAYQLLNQTLVYVTITDAV